jgi:hypothetical protein
MINLYGVAVLFVLVEILFLNSIKRPTVSQPEFGHDPWTYDIDIAIASAGTRIQPAALFRPVPLLGCFG